MTEPGELVWAIGAIALLGGYLCGSFPSGLVFGRLFGVADIRRIGSGNIGATNALRTGNRWLAALVLAGDVLKGTLAVVVALQIGLLAAVLAGIGAFVGHVFPVWLGFRGGKGVATYLGILLGFAPVGVLVFAVIWLAVAGATRLSSLAALAATLGVPLAYFFLGYESAAILTGVLTLLVYAKHHANIRRLLAGTEPKIGAKP